MKVTLVVSCYTSVPGSSDIPYFSAISSTFFVVFCPVSAVISGRGAEVSPSGLAVEISVVSCCCQCLFYPYCGFIKARKLASFFY